jgi:hypothetical protein
MPIFAFIFGVCLGKFARNYTIHKQQMQRLSRINSTMMPGEYLTWLSK